MIISLLMLGFIACFLWSIWRAALIAIVQLRQMHRVPCDRCVYFTNDYHLKCTVRPCQALTVSAIDCYDFEQVQYGMPKWRSWSNQQWQSWQRHLKSISQGISHEPVCDVPIHTIGVMPASDAGLSPSCKNC